MGKKILIGGGHGTGAVIEGMREIKSLLDIIAIVAVTDDGGSSKILRLLYNILAVGDVRNVIGAFIPNEEKEFRDLINFRFGKNPKSFLYKHPIGNLILVACLQMYKGDFEKAIQMTMRLFRASNTVLPATSGNAHLCARLDDETVIKGEGNIDSRPLDDCRQITSVFLEPRVKVFPKVANLLYQADESDRIILCPGSIWTSLISNLAVEGMKEALQKTRAKLVYVVNLMTNYKETRGWTALTHVKEIYKQLGRMIDVVICNTGVISEEACFAYLAEDSEQVDVNPPDVEKMSNYAHEIILDDFIDRRLKKSVRHSSRLAEIIVSL